MKHMIQSVLIALSLGLGCGASAQADEPIKAVYHMTDGAEQAARGLQNIKTIWRLIPAPKLWWLVTVKALTLC